MGSLSHDRKRPAGLDATGGGVIIFSDSIWHCADRTSHCETGWMWSFFGSLSVDSAKLTHPLQELLHFQGLFFTKFVPQLLCLQLFLLMYLL